MHEFPRRRSILASVACVLVILICNSSTLSGSAVAQANARRGKAMSAAPTTVVNLQDFGAIGDGVTNASPAFQQALDALAEAGGGTLLVPAGRYLLGANVSKLFNADISITITGEPSATAIDVAGNGTGLDLDSEFIVAPGENNNALSLSGLDTLLIKDLAFVGVQEVATDAHVVVQLSNIREATIQHCEFYGLASLIDGNSALVSADQSSLKLESCAFLGCATDSGASASLVQNTSWLGISVTDCKFIDYGNRPDFYSKTPLQPPYSWINIGNAADSDPSFSRREAIFRNVFLDEGGYFAISARPDFAGPTIAPFDVYMSRLNVNVNNLHSDGVLLVGARRVFIERSHFGWSHNAGFAINLYQAGEVILDLIDCSDDATEFNVEADRLAVINSNNTALESTAPFTRVITTDPDDDPAQFVRQQYLQILNREPEPAGHFYWTDKIVRCEADAACASGVKAALAEFLNASPGPTFSINGQVIDENSQPVPLVSVSISGSQAVSMMTDGNGNFAFENLATAGTYTVTATKDHYVFQSETIVTPASNQFTSISGTLARHTIAGRVLANTGSPLANATVTLSGTEERTATTAEDGNYSFADLPAGGSYVVSVTRDNYSFSISSQSVTDLSNDLFVVFEGAHLKFTIAGRLTDSSGVALVNMSVSLSGTATGTAFTNNDGDYSFEVFGGSDYTVVPFDSHYTFSPASASFTNITSNSDAAFTGVRNHHTIAGRVFANTGRVLSGATVSLSGSDEQSAISDVNGDFAFSDLLAGGDYVVIVQRNNYDFNVSSYSFSDLISDQSFAFEGVLRNYTISGNVKRGDGAAFPGVTVILSGGIGTSTVTDAGGNYSFTVHGEDQYAIRAHLTNYKFTPESTTFSNVSANQTADLVGELADYAVAGNFVTDEGLPLSDVTISVSGSDATPIVTSNGNAFVVSVQAEGDYVITPSKTNYTFSPASFSVSNLTANHQLDFVAILAANVPIMMAGSNPARALAIDAVLGTIEPFQLSYTNPWSADQRTRVMLFARHFDLLAGEGASNIIVTAEDKDHRIYPLTVEWAGKVDGQDWLIGVVVRLSDDMTDIGDVWLRISHNGLTSDPLLTGIGHIGGSPPP